MYKKFPICLVFLLAFSFSGNLEAQIVLTNPSIEGEPQDATMPIGWFGCAMGTTPDILPGFWGVTTEPSEGETYMGLITREDGSYESVGQRLKEKLKKNRCYEFELDLARSSTYEGYNFPIRLNVYIGYKNCSKDQLVYSSSNIEHTEWKTYEVKFDVNDDARYIIFEAYYGEGLMFSYKGNVIIDAISPIHMCNRA